jgi:hypothetical protein
LLGSDTPQAQRIVTGVDPRLAAAEAEEAAAEEASGGRPAGAGGETWGTRLDKLADDELSPEDREAKRNTELWKGGNKAKEFGYKWKVKCLPNPNPLATPCAVLCCAVLCSFGPLVVTRMPLHLKCFATPRPLCRCSCRFVLQPLIRDAIMSTARSRRPTKRPERGCGRS